MTPFHSPQMATTISSEFTLQMPATFANKEHMLMMKLGKELLRFTWFTESFPCCLEFFAKISAPWILAVKDSPSVSGLKSAKKEILLELPEYPGQSSNHALDLPMNRRKPSSKTKFNLKNKLKKVLVVLILKILNLLLKTSKICTNFP